MILKPCYLEDFIKLGFDREKISSTEYLEFFYSDRTTTNRLLSYKLAHLIYSSSSIVHLAIIEAIEETGNVLFEVIRKLAEQIEEETGIELRSCGKFHFSKESGHAITCDHAIMAEIEMDEQTSAEAIEKVNLVFAYFTEWTEELLVYAKQNLNHPYEPLMRDFKREMDLI